MTVNELNNIISSWENGLILFNDGILDHNTNLALCDNLIKAVKIIRVADDTITALFSDGKEYDISFLNTVKITTALDAI